jgi:type VI protein secretion system component Hcp
MTTKRKTMAKPSRALTDDELRAASGGAVDAFLKIDGVKGESLDDKHKNWIEVLSTSHSISQP